MKQLCTLLFAMKTIWLVAQTNISGVVTDARGVALPGVNVFVKGSVDGAISDAHGAFAFTTEKRGKQLLVASFVGFVTVEKEITSDSSLTNIKLKLNEKETTLEAVTVTAGSFEASDTKKAVALKPIDIVTVASSVGDVMGAMATLPGAQRSAGDGFLIVRGGDATETRTFIDGQSVEKPYTSHTPDMPSRGRFSPMLFKGTMFSTGGFSAQYGQALSSVLQLESAGLAERSQLSLSLMSVGVGAAGALRRDSMSLTSEFTYANMQPYYRLTGSRVKWIEYPHTINNVSTMRKRIGRAGMLKIMVQASLSNNGMLYYNIDTRKNDSLHLQNRNLYLNSAYQTPIGQKGTLGLGMASMIDLDSLRWGDVHLKTRTISASLGPWYKLSSGGNSIKIGVQAAAKQYKQTYFNTDSNYTALLAFNQPLLSAFVEFEHTFTKHFVMKHGYRYEYSSLNHEQTFVPRLSWAYKTSQYAQLSLAFGVFRQLQADDYMKFNTKLPSAKSIQYILNYQYERNNRLFRTEVYFKNYKQLIRYTTLTDYRPENYASTGKGWASGIDVFYRDRKTVHNGDFWVSYSFIKTERQYKEYPTAVQPEYVSPHVASVVYKQFFSVLHTQFGLSYTVASAKNYNNPNDKQFMSSRLQAVHDLSFCFSYLTKLLGQQMVIHGSVSNLLFQNAVYGYRFASSPNDQGSYESLPIQSVAKNMLFLGVFMNL